MKSRSSSGALKRFPLLWMAVAFAVGILLQYEFQLVWRYSVASAVFSGVAALFLRRRAVGLVLLGLCLACAGASAMARQTAVHSEGLARLIDGGVIGDGDPVEVAGTVSGVPEPSFGGLFITVEASRVIHRGLELESHGRIRLFLIAEDDERRAEFEQLGISKGAEISAVFRIRRGDRYLNPGVLRMRDVLAQKDLDATGTVKSPLLIKIARPSEALLSKVDPAHARNWLIEEFKSRLSPPTAGVMIASLLGDKYFLDKRTAEIFREGGTFHVLVISGLHITFIGGLILWLTGLLTRNLWLQFIASSIALWLFALAVGGDVPVIRAALMFTILLCLRAMNRDSSSVNAFGASALLLLVWRPSDLFSPSFLLTFVCTGAIVAMAVPFVSNLRAIGVWTPSKRTPLPPNVGWGLKIFCDTLYWREEAWNISRKRNAWSAVILKEQLLGSLPFKVRKMTARLFEGLVVSCIVQICLLPLQVRYFHRVSTGGILLNLWVETFIAAETFAAVIAVAVAQVSGVLAIPFISLTEFLNRALLYVPELFSEHGLSSVRVPVYPLSDALIWIQMIPLVFFASRILNWNPFDWGVASTSRAMRLVNVSMLILLIGIQLLVVTHPGSVPVPDGKLRVDFLDVGQGDSMLVAFPDGETMLIDGGGRVSFGGDEKDGGFEPDIRGIGEAVVSEFLWERGYSRIDYVLATHADTDHMQGLADVVRNFDVGRVFVARLANDDRDFIDLKRELDRKSVVPELLARGDRLEIGGVTVDVLNPEYSADNGASYGNGESLVLSLRFGVRRFLLAADIEKEGEGVMLARPETLRADLVKVAHHGSRTSSTAEFIEAVKASYAVISVGRTSPFGHPHREVVDRWTGSGAKILKTGETGTVTAETDGKSLTVRTYLGGG